MSIRGFLALEQDIELLPCTARQSLAQLRTRLKEYEIGHSREVKRLEPESLAIGDKWLFPFHGKDYYLATKIHYKCQTIEAYKIIPATLLEQEYQESLVSS
jgi:hypothetical protein